MPNKDKIAVALLVTDHMEHGVGCTDSALDVKARVSWAWKAVKSSPAVQRGAVTLLSLNVEAGTVNGSSTSNYAQLLAEASVSAGRVLPALAQSWNPDAPKTIKGNVSAKLGAFEKIRRRSLSSVRRDSVSSTKPCDSDASGGENSEEDPTVEVGCSLPMTSLRGAKRAAQAMLVASVFAAEISEKERVPVLVLGRPPGHHATCEHHLALDAPKLRAPGGMLEGASLGGGCFYPSCWLAAVHCLREGLSQRLAYIDVDAHKPDGVWKEVDHLCKLSSASRSSVLNGNPHACRGMVFASIHVDGFPNPQSKNWKSAVCKMPKGQRRAFEIRLHEELLPPGMDSGTVRNKTVLDAFKRWRCGLAQDLRKVKPNGVFVGLGFDLHKLEENIGDKMLGLGLQAEHYRKIIQDLPTGSLKGPIVLTLEGGYSKAAVTDGILGTMSGLEALSRKAMTTKRLASFRPPKHRRAQQAKIAFKRNTRKVSGSPRRPEKRQSYASDKSHSPTKLTGTKRRLSSSVSPKRPRRLST